MLRDHLCYPGILRSDNTHQSEMENPYFCKFCNVHLNGPEPLRQHNESQKHRSKVALTDCRIQQDAKYSQVYTPAPYSPSYSSFAPIQSQPKPKVPEKEYEFSGSSGSCNVCLVTLSSPQNRDQHLNGAKHKKKKAVWEAERRAATENTTSASFNASVSNNITPVAVPVGLDLSLKWSICDVCGKACNTPEQLRIHKDSPKCKKQANRGAVTPLGVNPADNTKWHECAVCKKMLNTPEQLEIHMKSHIGYQPMNQSSTNMQQTPSRQTQSQWDDFASSSRSNLERRFEQADENTFTKTIGAGRPNIPDTSQDRLASYLSSIPFSGPPSSSESYYPEQSFPDNIAPGPDRSDADSQIDNNDQDRNVSTHQMDSISSQGANNSQGLYGRGVMQDSFTALELSLHEDADRPNAGHSVGQPNFPPNPIGIETEAERIQTGVPRACDVPAPPWVDNMTAKFGSMVITQNEPSEELLQKIERGIVEEDCAIHNCEWHCIICNKHNRGGHNKKQHLEGSVHKKNLIKSMNRQTNNPGDDQENPFPNFQFYCPLCMVPFNSECSIRSHNQGKQHLTTLARSQTAPERHMGTLVKTLNLEICEEMGYQLTQYVPRSYQLELYEKAMQKDVVIFLPTGTGKTLVSTLMISQMLTLNPHKQVVFLVDKVLLVIQQSDVLRRQIGDRVYERFTPNGTTERRKPRIASLCGERQETSGIPIWQLDVLVVTAAFYRNLIDSSLVRWQDNSLVVIDEAHHCHKDHPFHVLLRDYHVKWPIDQRPKFLGLTASPAGLDGVKRTETNMQLLLRNMGGVHLVCVEDSGSKEELKKYTSNTNLEIKVVNMNVQEQQLYSLLLTYMKECYLWMEQNTNISDLCQAKSSWVFEDEEDEEDDVEASDMVTTLLNVLKDNKLQPVRINKKTEVEAMCWHLEAMGYAFLEMKQIGLQCALDQLMPLTEKDNRGNFLYAHGTLHKFGSLATVHLHQIETMVKDHCSEGQLQEQLAAKTTNDPTFMPAMQQLIHELEVGVNWDQEVRPIVLVLVLQRDTAKLLTDILSKAPSVMKRDLKVTQLVGHGRTGAGGGMGMAVRAQERVLKEIKQHQFQIVVATSIAEEGVDFPECELVIQMDPPSSVKALVQIRGRARKKGSRFIALCRTEIQRMALAQLIEQEKHMTVAVERIVKSQQGQM